MSTELEAVVYAEQQAKVVSLYSRAMTIPQIVRETQLSKSTVEHMLADFKEYALQDRVIMEKSREVILTTREHYDEIIRSMYETIQQAEVEGTADFKTKISALKAIADIENQRVNFMHKAGMMVDSQIGEQLAEAERKHTVIIDILKRIAHKHPKVGLEIQDMLSQVTNKVEGIAARTDES